MMLCVKFLLKIKLVFSIFRVRLYIEIIVRSISGTINPNKNDIKKNFLSGNNNFILNARYVCNPIKDIYIL